MATDSSSVYDITPLLEALQDSKAYSHPVETIHVVQTHTSCVFLTGEYAYKIKKPVNFGFLDYGTLELRRKFCEQELVLNQRLCPEIYLSVQPITRQNGQLQVGGKGTVVEWAVQMRQLQEKEMLPIRLQSNSLDRTVIERLAHLLADFHNRARTDATVQAYGSPSAIANTISMTLGTMQQVTKNTPLSAIHQELCTYFAWFQETHAARFHQRLKENHIRNCHGDLRAQNICLDARFRDGIQIFDCIEFNSSFRYIDTAADIAYLAMDLDLAGYAELRAQLLEVYVWETQDATLTQILPFYLAYRAMVRGNIALLAAHENEVPAEERQAQYNLANAAYDLSWSYAQRRPHPALLITVGFSGCGKSVLAQEVCRRLPAITLSSDRLRKQRAGVDATVPLQASCYAPDQRNANYSALFEAADVWLARNEHVLLDATFLDPQQRQAAAALAQKHDAEFWIIDCRCPDPIIRERLAARSKDPHASDAGLQVYLQQRDMYEHLLPVGQETGMPGSYIRTEMLHPVAEIAHTVMTHFLRNT